MRVILKRGLMVLTAEADSEAEEAAQWASAYANHVFLVIAQDEKTFRLQDRGPLPEACREPILVMFTSPDETARLISNLAHTPFELDGRTYASVEGFWQGLKFPDVEDRQRIAQLYGTEAKRAGQDMAYGETVRYEEREVRVGCYEHWTLMKRACRAKFTQYEEARRALLSTGTRPLVHKPRRDSQTIPGVIMADIWMKIRSRLLNVKPEE